MGKCLKLVFALHLGCFRLGLRVAVRQLENVFELCLLECYCFNFFFFVYLVA